MPRPTDHAKRRQEVAAIASALVAEGGTEAVTFRDVAKAAGCSTAIVSHYFADKRELLLHTYRAAAARAGERIDAALRSDGADVDGALDALLPLDEARRTDWKIWFAFWGKAIGDPELAAEQASAVREARRRLETVIAAARDSGRLGTGVDDAFAARRLLTVVLGIAVQVVFDPNDWPASRQRAIVAHAGSAQHGRQP